MLHRIPQLGGERFEDDLATPWHSPAQESLAGTVAAGGEALEDRRELRDVMFEKNATSTISMNETINETQSSSKGGHDYALMTNAGVVLVVLMLVCIFLLRHRRRAQVASLPRTSNVYNIDLQDNNASYILPAVDKDSGVPLELQRYALVIMPSSRDGAITSRLGIALP